MQTTRGSSWSFEGLDDVVLERAISDIQQAWGDAPTNSNDVTSVATRLAAAAVATDYVRPAARTRRAHRRAAFGIAGGLAASVLLTGGLAAAEVLPHGAQQIVADAGDVIGLDLPEPAAKSKAEEPAEREAGREGDAPAEANHGSVVSGAAKDHSDDEACGNHGRAVSAVARGEEACTPPPGQAKSDDAASDTPANNGDQGNQGKAADERPAKPEPKTPKNEAAPDDGSAVEGRKPEMVPPVPPVPPDHANAGDNDSVPDGAGPPAERGQPATG